jgi:hypothetical protein
MRHAIRLAVVVGFAIPAISLADPPQAAAPQTSTPAAVQAPAAASSSDRDKIECRTLPPKTGSRLGGRRECRSAREWEDIRQQNEREIEKMQTRDNLSPRQ